jgi:hypothetical protein
VLCLGKGPMRFGLEDFGNWEVQSNKDRKSRFIFVVCLDVCLSAATGRVKAIGYDSSLCHGVIPS